MNALFKTQNGYIVSLKQYAKRWGFHQVKNTNEVALYDAIYRSILNVTTVEQSDDADLGWLVIPVRDFNIPANGTDKNLAAFEAVYRVCSDNQELLAFASPVKYSVINDGDYVASYKLQVPADVDGWKAKRVEIWKTIAEIDVHVLRGTGFSISNKPITEEAKASVATALHDWVIDNVSNNTASASSSYWTHNAYSCLTQSTPRYSDCSGFSAAFQMLCQLYGINCLQVMGGIGKGDGGATTTRINHSWNMLSLSLPIGEYEEKDEEWYGVDIRFDQYIKDGNVKTDGVVITDIQRYLMSEYVYSDKTNTTIKGFDYTLRANNAVGYPVESPTGVYKKSNTN